jgi:hypothetical protein
MAQVEGSGTAPDTRLPETVRLLNDIAASKSYKPNCPCENVLSTSVVKRTELASKTPSGSLKAL